MDAVSGSLEVEDVIFVGNSCGPSGGAAAVAVRGDDAEVLDSLFVDNLCVAASGAGGGILAEGQGLLVDGCVFEGNRMEHGSAVHAAGAAGPVTLTHNVFVDNDTLDLGGPSGGPVGGAVVVGAGAFVANDLFGGNVGALGAGALLITEPSSSTVVANNVIVGNEGGFGGGIHLHVVAAAVGTIQNNVVVANAPVGVYVDGAGFPFQTRFNDVHANASDWGSSVPPVTVPPENVSFDPGFLVWSDDGDFGNDDFQLALGSPAIDGGNPASSWNDADGTPNDLGLFGGLLSHWDGP